MVHCLYEVLARVKKINAKCTKILDQATLDWDFAIQSSCFAHQENDIFPFPLFNIRITEKLSGKV
jgi:hypothetical protein